MDRSTNLILAAIAAGLWANAAVTVLVPVAAHAFDYQLNNIESHLSNIESRVGSSIGNRFESEQHLQPQVPQQQNLLISRLSRYHA